MQSDGHSAAPAVTDADDQRLALNDTLPCLTDAGNGARTRPEDAFEPCAPGGLSQEDALCLASGSTEVLSERNGTELEIDRRTSARRVEHEHHTHQPVR